MMIRVDNPKAAKIPAMVAAIANFAQADSDKSSSPELKTNESTTIIEISVTTAAVDIITEAHTANLVATTGFGPPYCRPDPVAADCKGSA